MNQSVAHELWKHGFDGWIIFPNQKDAEDAMLYSLANLTEEMRSRKPLRYKLKYRLGDETFMRVFEGSGETPTAL